MRKKICRITVLLLAVLVCLPFLSQSALAANITVGEGGVTVTFSCDNSSDSSGCSANSDGTGFVAQATGTTTTTNIPYLGPISTHYTQKTTITLKNENSFPILLDYSATLTQGSSAGSASHTGTGQLSLASGGTASITVSDKGAGNTSVLSFVVTKIINNTTYSVTCNTSSYGTYTANNGTSTVSSGTIDVQTSVGLTLTVTANDGYTCVGFVDSNGNWVTGVDKDGAALFVPAGTCTITPVFAATSALPSTAPFLAGGSYYYTWESAYAALGGAGTVVLAVTEEYALPTTLITYVGATVNRLYTVQGTSGVDYIIPAGGSFLIPYDSTYDTSTSKYVHSGSSASGAYATLTVPPTVTLKVNQGGTLIVNAQVVGNGNPLEGVAVGTYGKMIVGGTIDVYGSVYARGYIVDANHTTSLGTTDASGNLVRKGRFYARSGSDIHVLLQIDDYRGGKASNKIYESVFPTSDFYFCNIMIRAEYSAGATMQARYMVSTNETSNYTTVTNEIPVLGSTSESFLQQSGGTITMDYEYSTDKMVIEGKNTQITINDITIKFTYLFVEKVMSTSGKEIPICRNLQIIIGEGASLACSKNLKMIPGSSIQLKDGGTMNITGSVYLYGASDYNIAWMYGSAGCAYRRLPVTGLIKSAGSSVAETSDATITVGDDCTLTVGGNLLQSTNHSGGIIGHDGATLVINNVATYGSVNETANADGIALPNEDWASVSGLLAGLSTSETDYKPFSTPGTYYATGKWASTTNAAWYQYVISVADGVSGVTAVNGNGSVGETGGYVSVTHGTGDTAVTTSNVVGYSVNGGSFKFTVTSPQCKKVDTVTASNGTLSESYTLTGVTADSVLTVGLVDNHTEVTDAAVDATCTETGKTEGKHCSVCNTVLLAQEVVDALGHTEAAAVKENEVAATCTTAGSYDNVVYCTVCDEEISRETITVDATGHSYGGDEICDACGVFKFYATNVNLGNNLDMMFAFSKELATKASANKVVFTCNASSTEVTLTDEHVQKIGEINYYVVSYSFAAKQMCDEVTVTVCDSTGKAISESRTDSIQAYAMRMLARAETNEQNNLKTLIVDMLNYGAACQKYFDSTEDEKCANSLLSDTQKGYATQNLTLADTTTKGNTWRSSNLVTTSNIQFAIAFQDIENKSLTYTVTGHKGNVISGTEANITTDANGNPHILLTELVVADARCVITFTVDDSKWTESIYAYVSRNAVASEDDSTEVAAQKEALRAFMKFADSANAYLHDRNG